MGCLSVKTEGVRSFVFVKASTTLHLGAFKLLLCSLGHSSSPGQAEHVWNSDTQAWGGRAASGGYMKVRGDRGTGGRVPGIEAS
jgi:hypothetical protein